MAARQARTVGLTDQDVQRLRDQLADGKRPRVQLSGSQFAAAPSAAVVRIGDPAVDGSDYLTVRVKVNGVLDELAFAPAELQLGGRRTPAAEPVAAPRATRRKAPRATAATPPAARAPAVPVATPMAASALVPEPAAAVPPSSPGRHPRRRKPTSAATVSFTVASSGDSWTVSANRGAKGIVKHAPVQPGVVTALAELLGQPALLDAVAEINQTALSQAQARADELRAELHRLEAVLATHRTP